MPSPKQFFHYISYLQYPLIIAAMYFALKPIIFGFDNVWGDYNKLLILMGLSISFSTLQDTKKTQNNLSKKVWESPGLGKAFIFALSTSTFFILLTGIFGYFASTNEILRELSFGVIVLGIGLIGLLKAAVEMFENHRKDRQQQSATEPSNIDA